jgi:hypothetical protein
MTLSADLVKSLQQRSALRNLAAMFRKQRGRQALGYGAKLRMRRMDWIRSSQEQGVEVAAHRKLARADGKLVEHLKQYYPMHRHVR